MSKEDRHLYRLSKPKKLKAAPEEKLLRGVEGVSDDTDQRAKFKEIVGVTEGN